MKKEVILVGYSGHAYVAAEALLASGMELAGYLEKHALAYNPFDIAYLGFEEDDEVLQKLINYEFFPSIGSNNIRAKVCSTLLKAGKTFANAVHPAANVSTYAVLGSGILICRGSNINPLASIGNGVIINTGAIIEHECKIADFAHIAPGAVMAGNVSVGAYSFIGANAVIKEGVKVGSNVIVGAGAVLLNDVPDNQIVVGNPAKIIIK